MYKRMCRGFHTFFCKLYLSNSKSVFLRSCRQYLSPFVKSFNHGVHWEVWGVCEGMRRGRAGFLCILAASPIGREAALLAIQWVFAVNTSVQKVFPGNTSMQKVFPGKRKCPERSHYIQKCTIHRKCKCAASFCRKCKFEESFCINTSVHAENYRSVQATERWAISSGHHFILEKYPFPNMIILISMWIIHLWHSLEYALLLDI